MTDKKNRLVIGIMAHVDAGKTTLSEGLLFAAGMIRNRGRVDHGDAFLDSYALEKERGITIFSKQAVMPWGILIDTPGHVDFAPETERVLAVLDYAILVISATDGVQGHTRTLMRLLDEYEVPVFIFVNKMDQPDRDRAAIMESLKDEISDGCVDMSDAGTEVIADEEKLEEISMLDEDVMEAYLENGCIDDADIIRLIYQRKMFPCYFGSALRGDGVEEFYGALIRFTDKTLWDSVDDGDFSAKVFKITRDDRGERLTHIRVMSGELTPKDVIPGTDEKVNQIRLYSGTGYELMDRVSPGDICALTGAKTTYPGQGLGSMADIAAPVIEPVLKYSLILPEGVQSVAFLPSMRELAEEQPELHVSLDETTGDICIQVMGEVQTEILHDIISERYGVDVGFGQVGIVYKETVTKPVEGVGHYEPLRHYAEVHIAIEPLPPGSGIVVDSIVSTDELDINWQQLICTHLIEREHPGVLIGAPLDCVKLTVIGGRAHQKHTEGGDFRQATYRAVRQGLMKTECHLLEPYYEYVLRVPSDKVGRAMTDIERMCGEFTIGEAAGEGASAMSVLTGIAPVVTMRDYPRDVAAYTSGQGELTLGFHGYMPCHDEAEVIERSGYDPGTDEENPCGSVFCSHGAGYYVTWDEVDEKAHVQTGWKPDKDVYGAGVDTRDGSVQEESAEQYRLRIMDEALGVDEIDDILVRAVGSNKRADARSLKRTREKTVRLASKPSGPARPRSKKEKIGDYLLVDGYNVIHAWKELSELARDDMDQARGRLQDILCDYQGYSGRDVILVFDAYRVASHPTEIFDYHNIHVVYTRTAETADRYIERFSVEKADKYHVTVVTSDGLEQIIIRGAGAHLLSARDFEEEVLRYKTM